jgi:hypothetical protein
MVVLLPIIFAVNSATVEGFNSWVTCMKFDVSKKECAYALRKLTIASRPSGLKIMRLRIAKERDLR